jgi:hypothetical protein
LVLASAAVKRQSAFQEFQLGVPKPVPAAIAPEALDVPGRRLNRSVLVIGAVN